MYPYVKSLLRRRYPSYRGWSIIPQWDRGTYRPDFVVERRRRGLIERVIVEVKADCYIDLSHVEQLNEYAMYLAGRNVRIMKKILVIPAGARISQPALDLIDEGDIEVVRLRSFTCGY